MARAKISAIRSLPAAAGPRQGDPPAAGRSQLRAEDPRKASEQIGASAAAIVKASERQEAWVKLVAEQLVGWLRAREAGARAGERRRGT